MVSSWWRVARSGDRSLSPARGVWHAGGRRTSRSRQIRAHADPRSPRVAQTLGDAGERARERALEQALVGRDARGLHAPALAAQQRYLQQRERIDVGVAQLD